MRPVIARQGVTPDNGRPGVTPDNGRPGVTPDNSRPGTTPGSSRPGVPPHGNPAGVRPDVGPQGVTARSRPQDVAPSTAPIIAIDGPAAAGKGTLARRIAAALALPYLDTGLLYRAVGRRVLDAGGDPRDPATATAAARALVAEDLQRDDLRGPVADDAAASVAAIAGVRTALLDFQRGFGATSGAVLDGRDIGTVIFPDAPAKLYVTASPAERARRRWAELQARGVPAALPAVEAELRARDRRDAPNMRPAADAIRLDTTTLDADAAFAAAMAVIRPRLGRA